MMINPLIILIIWGVMFFSTVGITGYYAITDEPKFEYILFIMIAAVAVFPTIIIWVYFEAKQNEQKLKK